MRRSKLGLDDKDPVTGASTRIVTIGDPAAGAIIHVTLSEDQENVYILEQLQVADFATMTKNDQIRIANTDVFKNQLAPEFGLSTDYDFTSPDSFLQKTIAEINNFAPIDQIFSADDRQVFLDELDNIQAGLEKQGVFVATQINDEIDKIEKRFKRVSIFATSAATPEIDFSTLAPAPPDQQFKNVVSLDAGAGIRQGVKNFMSAERQIQAADTASLQLAETGTLPGLTKHLDVPSLLAAFEMNANLKIQGINASDTEFVNQVNQAAQVYSAMQELVNQTIAVFDVANSNEIRGLEGFDGRPEIPNNQDPKDFVQATDGAGNPLFDGDGNPIFLEHATIGRLFIGGIIDGPGNKTVRNINAPALTPEQQKVISMFETDLGGAMSPVEQLLGITRPPMDMYGNDSATLNYFEKNAWDQFANRLSQAATQFGEQTQQLFNQISVAEKERTSHFQNANDALGKLQDLLSTITRNIG